MMFHQTWLSAESENTYELMLNLCDFIKLPTNHQHNYDNQICTIRKPLKICIIDT